MTAFLLLFVLAIPPECEEYSVGEEVCENVDPETNPEVSFMASSAIFETGHVGQIFSIQTSDNRSIANISIAGDVGRFNKIRCSGESIEQFRALTQAELEEALKGEDAGGFIIDMICDAIEHIQKGFHMLELAKNTTDGVIGRFKEEPPEEEKFPDREMAPKRKTIYASFSK